MNILVVLAQDKTPSLNRFLCDRCCNYLKQKGHTVTVLDLYKHAGEIPFFLQKDSLQSITNKSLEDYPFFQVLREQFLAADMLLLFFPVYCFSVPAILKCWFDLLTVYAYEERPGEPLRPLHHVKKTFTVATMGMPWIYKVFGVHNCIRNQVKSIFSWIRIKENIIHELTSVEKIKPDNVEIKLNKLYRSLDRLSR